MTKIGTLLCACVLAACGGSSGGNAQAPAQPDPMPERETAAYEAPAAEPVEPTPAPEPEPAPPPPPPVREESATAELKPIKAKGPTGTVTFVKGEDDQITISGQFIGLKKGATHAIYVHEKGDCGKSGKAAGGHLNPTKAKHGPPSSSERHAGDFGNITADDTGMALFSMTTDSVTLVPDRPDSVLDRAVVIHAKKDNKKGDAGAALACGVIQSTTETTPTDEAPTDPASADPSAAAPSATVQPATGPSAKR